MSAANTAMLMGNTTVSFGECTAQTILIFSVKQENERTVTGMVEYIEREALINSFRSCGASKDLIDSIVHRINLQEAADVVPVVRCKDCTEWDEISSECSHWHGFRENDFCSYGERKDGETP